MNILEAMDAMDRGEKVRHKDWAEGMTASADGHGSYVMDTSTQPMAMLRCRRYGWSIVREQFDFMEASRRRGGSGI